MASHLQSTVHLKQSMVRAMNYCGDGEDNRDRDGGWRMKEWNDETGAAGGGGEGGG